MMRNHDEKGEDYSETKTRPDSGSGLQMKYFVLKPKGSDLYARASRAAMLAYAEVIEPKNHELSADLIRWVWREISQEELQDILRCEGLC